MARKNPRRDYAIGDRLTEQRMQIGMSQTEFGAACGVSRVCQYHYEKGLRTPDAIYLSAANAAGVDVLYIVTGRHAGDMRPPATLGEEKFAAEVLAAFRTLAKVIGESHGA